MYFDSQTNIVYISEALGRHGAVAESLISCLKLHNIRLRLIRGTHNIWARDYMPLQVNDHFIKFRYLQDFHTYPQLIEPPFLTNDPPGVIRSNIVLEGGNCVRYGDKAIVTDFIYKNNYQYKRKVIVDRIEKLLQAQLIVVPHEPYELTGHIDGMVRWIDEKNVFVNRMLDLEFEDKLVSVLLKHGLNCHAFPCSYRKFKPIKRKDFYKKYPDADAFQPSPGYYINYLHVGNLILYPSFDMEDDVACEQLLQQHFPDCVVKGINCYELSLWGGLIHCVTMNYKGPLC